jgi:nucleotide-binding universal stress UspA family protein
MERRIVFAVRRDRDTEWAVELLLRLHQREPIRVKLLSVQMPLNGHVRLFFSDADVAAFHQEDAERELAPVRRALKVAGIRYDEYVEVGLSAETIAHFAQEHGCSQIVLGPMRDAGLSGLILGSLTQQIEHLMEAAGSRCEVL